MTDDANSVMIIYSETKFKILELILKFDLSPKFQVVDYYTLFDRVSVCVRAGCVGRVQGAVLSMDFTCIFVIMILSSNLAN